MKNITKLLALTMVAVMLCMAFVSCGNKLSGTYTAELVTSDCDLTFKGDKVTVTLTGKITGNKTEVEGTYEINDGQITFDFSDDESEISKLFKGTLKFEKEKDTITIGSIATFTKK